MFAGKKSAQIREILISESAWEEMTCLFAPSSGLIPIEKMPLSKTERLMPLNINTAGKIFTHATWPRCRYIFVPDEAGVMKLVNVVKLRLKPLEEK